MLNDVTVILEGYKELSLILIISIVYMASVLYYFDVYKKRSLHLKISIKNIQKKINKRKKRIVRLNRWKESRLKKVKEAKKQGKNITKIDKLFKPIEWIDRIINFDKNMIGDYQLEIGMAKERTKEIDEYIKEGKSKND